jgi:hypothetical protein
MVYEPLKKEQLGVARFESNVGENAFFLDFPGKRRIGKDDFKELAGILSAPGGCQRVMEFDVCLFELVEVEIKDGDLYHVCVVIVSGEGVFLHEFPLRGFEKAAVHRAAGEVSGFRVFPQNVVVGRD